MKENNDNNKKTFKELWANKQTRALIKLGMWFAFFVFVFLVLFIISLFTPKKERVTNQVKTEEKTVEVNVAKMLDYLIDGTYSYEFKVTNNKNSYSYNGTKTKTGDSGYYEINNTIVKYSVVDDNYYEMVNEQINPDNIIMNEYDKHNLNLNYILDQIRKIDEPEVVDKTYTYDLEDGSSPQRIVVTVNNVNIEKIEMDCGDTDYELIFKNID